LGSQTASENPPGTVPLSYSSTKKQIFAIIFKLQDKAETIAEIVELKWYVLRLVVRRNMLCGITELNRCTSIEMRLSRTETFAPHQKMPGL